MDARPAPRLLPPGDGGAKKPPAGSVHNAARPVPEGLFSVFLPAFLLLFCFLFRIPVTHPTTSTIPSTSTSASAPPDNQQRPDAPAMTPDVRKFLRRFLPFRKRSQRRIPGVSCNDTASGMADTITTVIDVEKRRSASTTAMLGCCLIALPVLPSTESPTLPQSVQDEEGEEAQDAETRVINTGEFVDLRGLKGNLLVTARTGCGKTTAVINAIDEWLKEHTRVIVCEPTKAILREITEKLRQAGKYPVVDTGDTRSKSRITAEVWEIRKIVVTTYERAAHILSTRPDVFENAVLVLDEIHHIQDRKEVVQYLLTAPSRIVAMSATIPRVKELAEHLNATIVTASRKDEREFHVFYAGKMPAKKDYTNQTVRAVAEVLKAGEAKGTIVFVCNRKACELTAKHLRKEGIKAEHVHAKREGWREVVERFNRGEVDVVVATQVLAYGVNVNARRVVIAHISNWWKGRRITLSPADIMQMAGRVGRPGQQDRGRVDIIVFGGEEEVVNRALRGDYAADLKVEPEQLEDVILRLLVMGAVKRREDVRRAARTWFDVPPEQVWLEALDRLIEKRLVHEYRDELKVSAAGETLVKLALPVEAYDRYCEAVNARGATLEAIVTAADALAEEKGQKVSVANKLLKLMEVMTGDDLGYLRVKVERMTWEQLRREAGLPE